MFCRRANFRVIRFSSDVGLFSWEALAAEQAIDHRRHTDDGGRSIHRGFRDANSSPVSLEESESDESGACAQSDDDCLGRFLEHGSSEEAGRAAVLDRRQYSSRTIVSNLTDRFRTISAFR